MPIRRASANFVLRLLPPRRTPFIATLVYTLSQISRPPRSTGPRTSASGAWHRAPNKHRAPLHHGLHVHSSFDSYTHRSHGSDADLPYKFLSKAGMYKYLEMVDIHGVDHEIAYAEAQFMRSAAAQQLPVELAPPILPNTLWPPPPPPVAPPPVAPPPVAPPPFGEPPPFVASLSPFVPSLQAVAPASPLFTSPMLPLSGPLNTPVPFAPLPLAPLPVTLQPFATPSPAYLQPFATGPMCES